MDKDKVKNIKTALWLIPPFQHLVYGGAHTIFRFIETVSESGINNRIVVYESEDFDALGLKSELSKNFTKLKNYQVKVLPNVWTFFLEG